MARRFSGALLREKRLAAGLRPERLAMLIDRSVFSVHQYERDTAKPSISALAACADTLGCSVEDFFVQEAAA